MATYCDYCNSHPEDSFNKTYHDTQYGFPLERSITLTNAQPKVFKEDFALSCSVNPDMQVHFINGRYRIGSPSITTIKLGDISSTFYNSTCSSSSSGTVTNILSGPVNYIGPAPGALAPTAINGNTLSYTIANFSTLGAGAFDLDCRAI